MKRVRKIMAVLLYLLVVSLALELRPGELFDLRQFLLVMAGGVILYLPAVEKGDFLRWRSIDFELLSRNTIYASYIETFVLLFVLFSRGQTAGQEENLPFVISTKDIVLNLRPLLYGICIWAALGGEKQGSRGSVEYKGNEGEQNGKDTKKEKGGNGENAEDAEAVGAAWQRADEPVQEWGKTDRIWTAQECYQRFWELGLTRREAEVAVQVCKGLGNKEIARELNISETTVKKHVSNIFEKFGLAKREEIKGVLRTMRKSGV